MEPGFEGGLLKRLGRQGGTPSPHSSTLGPMRAGKQETVEAERRPQKEWVT